jgi:hypothetical protein
MLSLPETDQKFRKILPLKSSSVDTEPSLSREGGWQIVLQQTRCKAPIHWKSVIQKTVLAVCYSIPGNPNCSLAAPLHGKFVSESHRKENFRWYSGISFSQNTWSLDYSAYFAPVYMYQDVHRTPYHVTYFVICLESFLFCRKSVDTKMKYDFITRKSVRKCFFFLFL